jgi:type IV pilus assembly protein PilM
MAGISSGSKKRLVLDIGASAIRLAELAQTKTGHQLVKYYQREFNSDPALDEAERKAIREKALAELLKESKVRTRKAIFGVPGQSVFTRSRALPPVPKYKVSQIVRYEIQQQIPFSLDQIAMDYQILGRTEAGGYDVMMAAIKVDVVDKLVEILQSSKRAIDVADVNPLAAYNWLKHTGEFGDTGDCVALIDMGAATTDIVIEREGQFRFTRPLNIGGNDVTLAIASSFKQSFPDAERIKRERGFAPTGDPQTDGAGGEVIGNVLQRMVSEIIRSFAYFRSLPGGGQVNRVILCGGGACLRNIIPYMQRQLGLEVRIAQPLAGLAVSPGGQQVSDQPEQACVVLGMALRCQQQVAIEINLIPPRVQEAARRREAAFYWGLSITSLALIMACIIPQRAKKDEHVLAEIGRVQAKIRQYDSELAFAVNPEVPTIPASKKLSDFKTVQGSISGLESKVKNLDEERTFRRFWLEEFAFVNDARPPKMWFSAIETSTIGEPQNTRPLGGGGLPGARGGGGGGGFQNIRIVNPGLIGGGSAPPAGGEPSAIAETVSSTGFPNLSGTPGFGGGGGGARGSGGLFGGRDDDDDRRSERNGGSSQSTRSVPGVLSTGEGFPRPNGVRVIGFAKSGDIIQEFVENLRAAERTQANQNVIKTKAVHFSEASVLRLDRSILMQAWTEAESAMRGASGGLPPSEENSVYSFEVNIEFESPFYEAKPKNAKVSERSSSSRSDDDDDERDERRGRR